MVGPSESQQPHAHLLNGLVIGLVAGRGVLLVRGSRALSVVIGLGMIVPRAAAGLAGAAIPLGLRATGPDPAQ